jgi:hypothetical protein
VNSHFQQAKEIYKTFANLAIQKQCCCATKR